MKPTIKPILRKPSEEIEEFVAEAKKQIIGVKETTPSAPEELVSGGGSGINPKKAQQIQQAEDTQLRNLRMEKAKMLGEWRQRKQEMEREIMAANQQQKSQEQEQKQQETQVKKKKKEEKTTSSGEQAIVATGTSQKRPMGLFGLGKGKKAYKWHSAERKGRAPQ